MATLKTIDTLNAGKATYTSWKKATLHAPLGQSKGKPMTELHLKRTIFTDKSTIGMLSVEGVFECYVLEDTVREVEGQPVDSWKVKGQTAIPQGRYRIERTMSGRFGKVLPLLYKVPGYEGVRIHPGNKPEDTEGCLLPGLHKAQDMVTESRAAFQLLDELIENQLEIGEVWITIEGLPE